MCGFGLAAAGAGAAHAFSELRSARTPPSAVREPARGPRPAVPELTGAPAPCSAYLVGIAGTYRPRRLPVGAVVAGTFARCVGIGTGAGRHHRSAEAMGWAQGLPRSNLPPVGDTIPLCLPASVHSSQHSALSTQHSALVLGGLLSVAAASGSRYEAAARARAHPDAVAEEMEAFAVALAARLAGVSLAVIRGISNAAGDRDTTRWRTAEALAAARRVLEQLLAP